MAPAGRLLGSRHVSMIALGGVIGGGLLVGTGSVIHSIGPAAVLTYAIAGAVVYAVMRLLAEMAATRPSVGSFADYARDAFGDWVGFVSGWLYWYMWIITIAFEAIAGAQILRSWGVDAPPAVLGLALLAVLALSNSFTVRAFGEFEFWLASVKVAAIVVFLGLGTAALLGLRVGTGPAVSLGNLVQDGGFFPHGVGAVVLGVVAVIFSYGGVEVATIAAAESDDPQRLMRRVVASLVWRIAIFYMGAVLVLTWVIPWPEVPTETSPFAAAFARLGIPAAQTIMEGVVLTAVLSVLNTGLYTTPRMLLTLAQQGDAPNAIGRVNRRGTPLRALLVSVAASAICIAVATLATEEILYFLTTSVGAVIVINYLFITASHYRLRRRLGRDGVRLPAPGFPMLDHVVIVVLLGVLVSMAFVSSLRPQLIYTLVSLVVIVCLRPLSRRWSRRRAAAQTGHLEEERKAQSDESTESDESAEVR
jgi:GABA permease